MLNPYVLLALALGLLAACGASFGYGHHVATAECESSQRSALAAQAAQVNAENLTAIARVRAEAKAASDAALAEQVRQRTVISALTKQKEKLTNAPPRTDACNAVTPRDDAVLDGVRSILAAADQDPGGTGPAAVGADGRPAATGAASPVQGSRREGPADAGPSGVGGSAPISPGVSPGLGERLRSVLGL